MLPSLTFQRTNNPGQTLSALAEIAAGRVELDAQRRAALFDALGDVVRVLAQAPSGHDPIAVGVWSNHDRLPALARLADVLLPESDATAQLAAEQERDAETARALLSALLRQPAGIVSPTTSRHARGSARRR